MDPKDVAAFMMVIKLISPKQWARLRARRLGSFDVSASDGKLFLVRGKTSLPLSAKRARRIVEICCQMISDKNANAK